MNHCSLLAGQQMLNKYGGFWSSRKTIASVRFNLNTSAKVTSALKHEIWLGNLMDISASHNIAIVQRVFHDLLPLRIFAN